MPTFSCSAHSPCTKPIATLYAYGCIHQYCGPPSRWQIRKEGHAGPGSKLGATWEEFWGTLDTQGMVRWSEVSTWVGHLPLTPMTGPVEMSTTREESNQGPLKCRVQQHASPSCLGLEPTLAIAYILFIVVMTREIRTQGKRFSL